MKIKYLGTAAAEAFPAMFCACENCKKAREHGGKNIRSRSQAIIDGKLLLDFPCDSYYHFEKFSINWLDIKSCLVTHTHSDHFYVKDFDCTFNGCSHPPEDWHGFALYGSQDLKKPLEYILNANQGFFSYNQVEAFKPFMVNEYTVTALKAVHGTENPYIYIIEKNGKKLLYAHDTGILPEQSFNFIKENQIRFDLVSMDCTEGMCDDIPYEGHMCLGRNIKFRDILKEMGAVDSKTVLVLNHFSHNGLNAAYVDFSPVAEKEGFITSFDGMEIEI